MCVSPRNGKELEAWRLSHHANGNNSQTQHRDVTEQVLTSASSVGDVCVCVCADEKRVVKCVGICER